MNYGLYLSTAGIQAQFSRMTVITNNMANANTAGFKRDLVNTLARANASYEDPQMAAYRVPVLKDQGGGAWATNGGIDLTQGPLAEGNSTDMALDGRGFFTVQGTGGFNGQTLLTRNGTFIVREDGTLVTADGGMAVLGTDGKPIQVNPNLPFRVDANGSISQGDQHEVAQLKLVDVADSQMLRKLGKNLLTASKTQPAPADTVVRQGKLEGSGVESMTEMVNMIECQRAFDANAKMVSYQDQTMQQLNTVGRVA
jgi:flagellar basal body rod protein FlgG